MRKIILTVAILPFFVILEKQIKSGRIASLKMGNMNEKNKII